jgi:hypothetical protein
VPSLGTFAAAVVRFVRQTNGEGAADINDPGVDPHGYWKAHEVGWTNAAAVSNAHVNPNEGGAKNR